MKKFIILLSMVTLLFACSTFQVSAASSPGGKVIETGESKNDGRKNNNDTSPKTSGEVTILWITAIGAAGIGFAAKKKLAEENK